MSPRLAAPEVKLLALKPRAVTADGTFSGYASLFGIADLGRDVMMPGAFAASLARRGPSGIRMLWQHDPAEPVGRWLSIAEDARGLHVRGQLNLAVARARELAALIGDGAVDGLSIGFRTEKARPEYGLRRLLEVDLWEISLVTFPMLPGARVEGRSAPPLPACGERTSREATAVRGPRKSLLPSRPLTRPPLRSGDLSPQAGRGADPAMRSIAHAGLALAIRRAAARLRRHPSTHRQPTRTR